MPIELQGGDTIFHNPFANGQSQNIASSDTNDSDIDLDDIVSATTTNAANQSSIKYKFNKLLTNLEHQCSRFRIYNIPIINYIILLIFAILLIRLSFRYHKLYTKSSLVATIATNIVLYAIADTLAQSISAFNQQIPFREQRSFSNYDVSNYIDEMNTSENPENLFVDYGCNPEQSHQHSQRAYDIEFDFNSLSNHEYNLDDNSTEFKFYRFLCFIFWGFLMAFVQVVWYSFLNNMYTDMPSIVSVLERVLTDQLCFSPVSLICFFIYGTIVIERGNENDVKNKLYKIYLSTLVCNFSLWFPVQFVNFLIMPKKFQVPFSSTIGVLWNCFLSLRNASSGA